MAYIRESDHVTDMNNGEILVVLNEAAKIVVGECDVSIEVDNKNICVMIGGKDLRAFMVRLNALDIDKIEADYVAVHTA